MNYIKEKLFSKAYWHRKYYSWLKKRHSLIWAWPLSKERYYSETGRKLSYRHPDDINQKLMWLNRYSNDPRRSECADKYAVRSYVEKCGYGEALVPLIGVWESVDQIDFDKLPNQFVLKCNHGCGFNIICSDKTKFDIESAKKSLDKWMHLTYDTMLQEKHYRFIEPKIICEKYLEQLDGGIVDYKFNCFKGKVHSCLVAYNRDMEDVHGSVCFDQYDINWILKEAVKPENHVNRRIIEKPKCYEYMLEMCSVLSKDFDYVRVDLYEIEGKVYFGEMTFTPTGCIMTFYYQEYLDELGEQLQLPNKKNLT